MGMLSLAGFIVLALAIYAVYDFGRRVLVLLFSIAATLESVNREIRGLRSDCSRGA